ncbi:hypothetical protein Ahu01nite_030130 [Winogradskya humida]|uniref:DUF5666 domain-containing protein n=1 Tax=Winogradskya humida TaxID=113566 RepID=A0ABQ3ZMV0_9ACTN|nr:hypothetical protein Ahu01nite_030130 [Actinoplanes humidus]
MTIGSGATVTVDGKAATLADVPVGARVRFGSGSSDSETKTITTVTAVTSWDFRLGGTISAIDAATGTLTVTRPARGRSDDTSTSSTDSGTAVVVGSEATVTVDGKAATFADLTTGLFVQVSGTQNASGQTVTRVTASTTAPARPTAGTKPTSSTTPSTTTPSTTTPSTTTPSTSTSTTAAKTTAGQAKKTATKVVQAARKAAKQ